MAGGDPHAERRGEDLEVERRAEVDRFAVDTGVHRRRPIHLDDVAVHARPGSGLVPGASMTTTPRRPPSSLGRVPGATGRSSAYGLFDTSTTAGLTMLVSLVVHEAKLGCRRARPEHLACRLEQGSRLRVAIRRLPNRLAVDPE